MHRNAKFYELKINADCRYKVNGEMIRTPLKPIPLQKIAAHIDKIRENELFLINSKGVKTYLADVELDKRGKRLLILLNKSDSTEPDPTISNPETGERKKLEKPDGFGNDYSAHILVSLEKINSKPHTYNLVYESVRGSSIYGTHIVSFFNALLRRCREISQSDYLAPHPAGVRNENGPITVNSIHTFELSGKISDDFERDLRQGFLEDIELIDYNEKGTKWDQNKEVAEIKKAIYLSVSAKPKNPIATIRDVLSKGNQKSYERAVIRFKDNRDASQSLTLNTEDFTLTDDTRYVKKTRIKAQRINDTGYESIQQDIKNELIRLL